MAHLFEVLPDDDVWGNQYYINASNKWGLPGVTCPLCRQTWASVGLAYPSVDLTRLPNEKRYREFKPVALEELEDLKTVIEPLAPKGAILRPGTDFGPLVGTARGKFADFAWVNSWTLLIQREALNKLLAARVKMPKAAPTLLTYRSKDAPELLELEIEPYTKISQSSFKSGIPPSCPSCGRDELIKPKRFTIDRSSVPQNLDMFKGRDFTTLILATEQLADAVKTLHLNNILFREVKVLD